jgi:hypothetical protein
MAPNGVHRLATATAHHAPSGWLPRPPPTISDTTPTKLLIRLSKAGGKVTAPKPNHRGPESRAHRLFRLYSMACELPGDDDRRIEALHELLQAARDAEAEQAEKSLRHAAQMEMARVAAQQAAMQQRKRMKAMRKAIEAERVRDVNRMEHGRTVAAKRQKIFDSISPLAPPVMIERDNSGGRKLYARQ